MASESTASATERRRAGGDVDSPDVKCHLFCPADRTQRFGAAPGVHAPPRICSDTETHAQTHRQPSNTSAASIDWPKTSALCDLSTRPFICSYIHMLRSRKFASNYILNIMIISDHKILYFIASMNILTPCLHQMRSVRQNTVELRTDPRLSLVSPKGFSPFCHRWSLGSSGLLSWGHLISSNIVNLIAQILLELN